jgi:Domain of unknown function (DUF4760)
MDLATIKPWFDAVTALSGFLVAVVSLLLLRQLSLLREQNNLSRQQLEEANSWNKRNATFSFISPEQHAAQIEAIRKILRKHEIDVRSFKPLDNAETNKLIDDEESYHALINALNFYEHYAVAVNSGLFDDEAAYGLDSAPVIRVFRRFEGFINCVRRRVDVQAIYVDLEKLALRWETREKAREGQNREELAQLRRALLEQRGVRSEDEGIA